MSNSTHRSNSGPSAIWATVDAHPPETRPVLVVAVDKEPHARFTTDDEPLERASAFRFLVDDEPNSLMLEGEDHGDDVRCAVRANRRKAGDPSLTKSPLGLGEVHALEDRSSSIRRRRWKTTPGCKKENTLVQPNRGDRTVIFSLEDGPATLDNQLYMYVGKKDHSATASVLARNGLDNGKLFLFRSLDPGRNSERTFTSGSVTGEWVEFRRPRTSRMRSSRRRATPPARRRSCARRMARTTPTIGMSSSSSRPARRAAPTRE